ncbi:hypothetical protein D9M73_276000 [compost metagenome]
MHQRQARQLGQQILLHGAADAAVLQAVHRVRDLGDDCRIDVQFAEVIDDDRQAAAVGTLHHAIEQGGLAGPEKTRDHGHRNTPSAHQACPSSTGGSPCHTAFKPDADRLAWRS